MRKFVTFSLNCTYTISVDLADGEYSEHEIECAARKKLNQVTSIRLGDLDNDRWEVRDISDEEY